MDTNKMREQFEAAYVVYCEKLGWKTYTAFHMLSDVYLKDSTELAWQMWQASRATYWQPMESCPKHVDVLFYREDCGVISGQLTCADTFMTEKDRESGDYSEEEQYSEDAWCYGPDGVERLDGDLVPTHWMPYPAEPALTP
ncbi:hypothetical protein [Pseudomonas fulva]|uniref:hypothetical protein n=1 Tax=Pseudomonas fulva TaxID=47880 RepID=UPI003D2F2ED4